LSNDINKNTIKGVYNSNNINKSIIVSNQDAVLKRGSTSLRSSLIITQEFLPKPYVKYDLTLSDDSISLLNILSNDDLKIELQNRSVELHVFESSSSSNSPSIIKARAKREPVTLGKDENINEVIFHVVNFVDYWADNFDFSSAPHKYTKGNRLSFVVNDFSIVIESLEYTQKLIKSLNSTGGYAITHIGKITTLNDKHLTGTNINIVLDQLYWFLSFSKGAWTPTILPVGFNSRGEKIWEQLGSKSVESWRNTPSWFDPNNGKSLPNLFKSFTSIYFKDDWENYLKTAIYWYINANAQSSGADGSIIIIQAALERLSWAHYVNNTKSISSDGFSKMKASDQIRLLLTYANITLAVPESLESLHSFSKEFNFDGPEAFTYIRNRLVHPPKGKEKKYISKVIGECWILSLWYLELVILKFLGYNEQYSNRLKRQWLGEVELVPWSDS